MWSTQKDINSMIHASLKRNKQIRHRTTYNSARSINIEHCAFQSFVPQTTDPLAWTALPTRDSQTTKTPTYARDHYDIHHEPSKMICDLQPGRFRS